MQWKDKLAGGGLTKYERENGNTASILELIESAAAWKIFYLGGTLTLQTNSFKQLVPEKPPMPVALFP